MIISDSFPINIRQLNYCRIKEPLIKSLHNALSDGFSSVGSDAYGFNQCFLNNIKKALGIY